MEASTRSGVLSSPSRPVSSPRAASMSRTLSANGTGSGGGASGSVRRVRSGRTRTGLLSLPLVVDIVSRRLPQAEMERQGRRQHGSQLPPADHGDVLGGRDQLPKPGHVDIEVLVIEVPEQPVLRELFEVVQIKHVAGLGIDLAFDRQLELVIVPVKVGIVALPIRRPVPLVAGGGIVQTVRG